MSSEKTEKPTDKKRKDAGKRGQSFKSRDVVAAMLLLCGVLVVTAHASAVEMMGLLMAAIDDGFRQDPSQYTRELLGLLARIVLPILAVCIAAVALPSLYQSKFVLATEALGLKFDALNPVNGFKKLFSVRTVKDFVKTILYLLCFCVAGVIFWEMQKQTIMGQIHADAGDLLKIWSGLLLSLVLTGLACILAILALDVLAEIFLLTKDLKMEKQEVKREYKEQDGNPDIKARRRELHLEILSSQLKSDVENSNFVVVNPTHIAIGIYFKPDIVPFPFVSVIETNQNALQVRAYAEKTGVPVIQDIPLARRLYRKYARYSFIEVTEIEEILRILIWLMQAEDAAAPAMFGEEPDPEAEAPPDPDSADESTPDSLSPQNPQNPSINGEKT